MSKQIHTLSEQSDDQIEKIRDDLRHKKDEEKRRIDLCRDVEQQIGALEEQLCSIEIDADEQQDLQVSASNFILLFDFSFSEGRVESIGRESKKIHRRTSSIVIETSTDQ